jgi:ribonuclease G
VERTLRRVAREQKEREITVRLHPEVALYLLEEEPKFLKDVRKGNRMDVNIRDNPVLQLDEFRLISEPAGREVTKEYEVV